MNLLTPPPLAVVSVGDVFVGDDVRVPRVTKAGLEEEEDVVIFWRKRREGGSCNTKGSVASLAGRLGALSVSELRSAQGAVVSMNTRGLDQRKVRKGKGERTSWKLST